MQRPDTGPGDGATELTRRDFLIQPKEVFGRDHQFLERAELLTFEAIERVARIFVDLGVNKIRLTGGEPSCAATSRVSSR